MGYGICGLLPYQYYEMPLFELVKMTNAKINYELMKVGKYKPRRTDKEIQETADWLKSFHKEK